MTFKAIYDSIIPLWGETIDFSDGMIIESKNALKTLGGTPANTTNFYSQTLSNQWAAVEEVVEKEDTFRRLMVWTMYQVFHRHAHTLFEQEILSLKPAAIDKEEIEAQYFKNLKDENWEDELAQYERTIE